jgi:hypothetical protein
MRNIHPRCVAERSILVSVTNSGRIARGGEEVEIFGRGRDEIDESTKPVSQTGGQAARY